MSTPPKWRNFPDVDILLWFALAENGDLLVALKHDDRRTEVKNVIRRKPPSPGQRAEADSHRSSR